LNNGGWQGNRDGNRGDGNHGGNGSRGGGTWQQPQGGGNTGGGNWQNNDHHDNNGGGNRNDNNRGGNGTRGGGGWQNNDRHDNNNGGNWGGNNNRDWDRGHDNNRDWDRGRGGGGGHFDWHNDHRWNGYSGVRLGFYFFPGRGYYRVPDAYYDRQWRRGEYLPSIFYSYRITDWYDYGLPQPPYGCAWYFVGEDAVLMVISTGEILDVIYNFW
jgi:Ni/Co efflux regulator RcnB